MSDIEIRPALLSEVAAISNMMQESVLNICPELYTSEQIDVWLHYYRQERIEYYINNTRFFAMWKGTELLGTAGLEGHQLFGVYVNHRHSGQGLGRLLVEYIEQVARQSGLQELTFTATPAALNFYRRLGFEIVRPERTVVDGVAYDETRMRKQLSSTD